ncbi:hypothetical protein ENBRE01_2678 [Enteropsectra breve]|nr:hypothetical protein ENBRE01_2189 [Enteropsectra breve]KAI5152240.1 hypothetical protein ENBRE01_2678 [Enteropsectra breve]
MECVNTTCSFCFKVGKDLHNHYVQQQFEHNNCAGAIICVKNKLVASHLKSLENIIASITSQDYVGHLQATHGIQVNYTQAYASLQITRREKKDFAAPRIK